MRHLAVLLVLWPLVAGGQTRTVTDVLASVDDTACVGEVLLADIDGVRAVGACSDGDAERTLDIAVTNQQVDRAGPLRAFRLGFCGSVVLGAGGPEGWVSTIDANRSLVTWSRGGHAFGEPGLLSGARLDGFTVALKPGWRRSSIAAATWEHATVAVRASLDCETSTAPRTAVHPPLPKQD